MHKLHSCEQILKPVESDTQAGTLSEFLISHAIILLVKFSPLDGDKAGPVDHMGGHAPTVIIPL